MTNHPDRIQAEAETPQKPVRRLLITKAGHFFRRIENLLLNQTYYSTYGSWISLFDAGMYEA